MVSGLRLDLKVDVPTVEDLQAALNRVQSQLSQKAPAQAWLKPYFNLKSSAKGVPRSFDHAQQPQALLFKRLLKELYFFESGLEGPTWKRRRISPC